MNRSLFFQHAILIAAALNSHLIFSCVAVWSKCQWSRFFFCQVLCTLRHCRRFTILPMSDLKFWCCKTNTLHWQFLLSQKKLIKLMGQTDGREYLLINLAVSYNFPYCFLTVSYNSKQDSQRASPIRPWVYRIHIADVRSGRRNYCNSQEHALFMAGF